MKFLSTLILAVAFTALATVAFAQDNAKKIQEATFKVSGVCDMCKKRIEEAALVKGVKMATWDKHAQQITIYYRPNLVTTETVEKAIAGAGHDTAKFKAADEVYDKLPACCDYRSGLQIH